MASVVSMDARDGHSIIAFPRDVSDSASSISDDLEPIVDRLEKTSSPAVLVDLTAPEYISSLVVAAVVRLYKNIQNAQGRMAVVVRSDDHPVAEILKAAGLTKLWPVVTSHEMAVHELGLSKEAKTEERERKLSSLLAPVAVLTAAFLLSPFLAGEQSLAKSVIRYLIFGLSGISVVLGVISATREQDWKRWLSVGVILGGLVIASITAWILWIRVWLYPHELDRNFKKNSGETELTEPESSPGIAPARPVDAFKLNSKSGPGLAPADANSTPTATDANNSESSSDESAGEEL